LPILSGHEIVKIFEQLGRGSHIILVKEGCITSLSVPDHREVARGTLRSLIAHADITVEEFLYAIQNRRD